MYICNLIKIPTTSYVAAMFHPTIGQCAHQFISTTSTPNLGMISTRNYGTTGSHIAKNTSKLSQAKHSWVYQAAKVVEMRIAKLMSSTTKLWTPTQDLA